MDPEQILAGLNAEQYEAVTVDAPVVVIRAGAGSGKTRVLTRRIAYGAAIDRLDPRRALALTFTRKAAGELNQRLRQLGLRQSAAAGTFHSIALAQLRQRWEEQGRSAPGLLERKYSFVARMLPGTADRTTPLDVISEIEWAKARRILPDKYQAEAIRAGRVPPLDPATIADLYLQYEETKTARHVIDFDDILILCGRHLQRDSGAASAFRWKFRHVFVDEFQDVNPLQFALLKVFTGSEPDLCAVGDSRQAIYAWNGADSGFLDHFEDHFPGAIGVTLQQNYRSSPEILAAASAMLPDHGRLVPTQASGDAPSITAHATGEAEAEAIARALRLTQSSRRKWADMAVLVRTNAQVVVLSDTLSRYDIPVNARTETRLLERPEVQDALDRMRPESQRLGPALDDLTLHLDTQDEPTAPADVDRRAVLDAFVRLGRDHLAVDMNATVESFVTALKAGTADGGGHRRNAVDVTTFHAAKGLEWDIVHIAGVERGLTPIAHAATAEGVAEEHRLMYVALTRARRSLHLHWAAERTFGDRVSQRNPSPFLEAIAAATPTRTTSERLREATRQVQGAKSALAPDGGRSAPDEPAHEPTVERLRTWRSSVARANGVPAHIVMHDDVLHALAQRRPASRDALAEIAGLGPIKVAQYGDDLLRLIAESA